MRRSVVTAVPGGGLADDRDRDGDLDLLTGADADEVDVLDVPRHRVALDVPHEGQLVRTVDRDGDEGVLVVAHGEERLVRIQCDVDGLGAVSVDDGGDLASAAEAACGALAEIFADGVRQLDGFNHSVSFYIGTFVHEPRRPRAG